MLLTLEIFIVILVDLPKVKQLSTSHGHHDHFGAGMIAFRWVTRVHRDQPTGRFQWVSIRLCFVSKPRGSFLMYRLRVSEGMQSTLYNLTDAVKAAVFKNLRLWWRYYMLRQVSDAATRYGGPVASCLQWRMHVRQSILIIHQSSQFWRSVIK